MHDGKLVEGGVAAQTGADDAQRRRSPRRGRGDARRRRQDAVLPHRHGHVRRVQRRVHHGVRRPPPGPLDGRGVGAAGGLGVEVEAWAYKPRDECSSLRAGARATRRTSPTTTPSGACPSTTPHAVRVPRPGRRPGRAVVVDDPAQARRLRALFAGFDPAAVAASTTPTSPAASPTRHRAQPGQGQLRRRQRQGVARAGRPGGLPVGLRRRHPVAEPLDARWATSRRRRAVSDAMSKALKQRGFRFVGPTICYALMQACGLVNDHVDELLPPRRVRRPA